MSLPKLEHKKNGKQIIRVRFVPGNKEVQLTLKGNSVYVRSFKDKRLNMNWLKVRDDSGPEVVKLINTLVGYEALTGQIDERWEL